MTVSKSFTEAGTSDLLSLKPGDSATYGVSGTYTGRIHLEKSGSPTAVFEPLEGEAPAADSEFSGTVKNETKGSLWYRFRAVTLDSGTADCELPDVDDAQAAIRST